MASAEQRLPYDQEPSWPRRGERMNHRWHPTSRSETGNGVRARATISRLLGTGIVIAVAGIGGLGSGPASNQPSGGGLSLGTKQSPCAVTSPRCPPRPRADG